MRTEHYALPMKNPKNLVKLMSFDVFQMVNVFHNISYVMKRMIVWIALTKILLFVNNYRKIINQMKKKREGTRKNVFHLSTLKIYANLRMLFPAIVRFVFIKKFKSYFITKKILK